MSHRGFTLCDISGDNGDNQILFFFYKTLGFYDYGYFIFKSNLMLKNIIFYLIVFKMLLSSWFLIRFFGFQKNCVLKVITKVIAKLIRKRDVNIIIKLFTIFFEN